MKRISMILLVLAALAGCAKESASESGSSTRTPMPGTAAGTSVEPAPQPEEIPPRPVAPPEAPGSRAVLDVPPLETALRTSIREVAPRLGTGDMVLLDVRNSQAFAQEHAAGAINIPLEEVAARARELPFGKTVITYCT